MKKIEKKNIKNEKQLVASALLEMQNDGYSNIVLNNLFEKVNFDINQKNYSTRVFYGVIERKITLEHVIKQYVKKKPDVKVVIILMMGLYQLLYMDGAKDYAVVDETVKLCSFFRVKSATGFVNAVLRNFLRDDKKIIINTDSIIKSISIEYSCGKDIVKNLLCEYSESDVREILSTSLGRPRIYARVNTMKLQRETLIENFKKEGIIVEVSPYLKNAVFFTSQFNLEDSKTFKEGNCHIQDLSSQLAISELVENFERDGKNKILDMCAAPGGKSFTIAQEFGDNADILAQDIYDFKLRLIDQGSKKLELKSIKSLKYDGEKFNSDIEGRFDIVICDVPCSGVGIISKKPEIKYKTKDEYSALPAIQRKILRNGARYLKVGGTLLYSTCTLFKKENDDVVSEFLKENSNFRPQETSKTLGECYINQETKGVTILPRNFNSDGFYISLLTKGVN